MDRPTFSNWRPTRRKSLSRERFGEAFGMELYDSDQIHVASRLRKTPVSYQGIALAMP